jgi:hypothetical protein
MRPKGSAAEPERRRLRATELLKEAELPGVFARILNVSVASIRSWRRLVHHEEDLKYVRVHALKATSVQ